MELSHGPAAILLTLWALLVAAALESCVADIREARDRLRRLKDAP
jgi:hypothetical protein